MKSIFSFLDYKDYLQAVIAANSGVRGYKSQLARAAGCQRSYFTQVLNGGWHLTLEHGAGLAEFFGFTEIETEYFLDLISFSKTSLPTLKKKLKRRLDKARASQEDLSSRFSEARLQQDQQLLYYSSWIFSALHILTSVPEYQALGALAERINVPPESVRSFLIQLKELGLVKNVGDRWMIGTGHIHLPKDSSLNRFNHANWRERALLDAQGPAAGGLHYTVVQSQSTDDFAKIKDMILGFIQKSRGIVADSKEEDVACLCLDYFWI